jgi:trehalose-phosphatase
VTPWTVHGSLNALAYWQQIETALSNARECFLFLDYDGTLAPIVSNPEEAVPAPGIKDILVKLSGMDGIEIAVISGRSLADVRSRLGLDLIYAGNHGLEIEGHGIRFIEATAVRVAGEIERICDSLAPRIVSIPGASIERKGLTATVHYRQVPAGNEADLVAAVLQAAQPYSGNVEVRPGRKVLEFLPRVQWGKGKAARMIMETVATTSRVLPVCLGDDVTDEDLFREFQDGITVRVGEQGRTAAKYFVRDVSEAGELLNRIARAWADKIRGGLSADGPDRMPR